MDEIEKQHFYEVSGLNQTDVIKWCNDVGITEDEYIKVKMDTLEYQLKDFYFALFKLVTLRDFQILMVIYLIGLILICIVVEN